MNHMASALDRMSRFTTYFAIAAIVLTLTVILGAVASADDGNKNHNHDHGSIQRVTNQPLEILGNSCEGTDLGLHDGFQNEKAVCVATEFGEQSAFNDNPTLLIVDSPNKVKRGEDIVLKVSTRNLVRDRFLAAGDGGYYKESAFLNEDGLTRGHFHTGCRRIGDEAPEPFRLGNQFVATEDSEGNRTPDTVRVTIPGFDEKGMVQCASWAGDGSHRIPMMSFANEIPAFDAVRIEVK